MIYIRNLVEKVCHTMDIDDPVKTGRELDKYSLEEWLKSQGAGKTALATIGVACRMMLGLESSQVSALFFLNYCKSGGGIMQMRADEKHGGQHLRLVKGDGAFSATPIDTSLTSTNRNPIYLNRTCKSAESRLHPLELPRSLDRTEVFRRSPRLFGSRQLRLQACCCISTHSTVQRDSFLTTITTCETSH